MTGIKENEARLVEYFDDHFYKVTDKGQSHYIASVTTKLGIIDKPFLAKWRGDIGNREADLRVYDAQQRGKRIHFAWYVYTSGGNVIYNPWQKPNYTEEEVLEFKKQTPYFIELKTQDEMLQMWKLQRFFELLNPTVLHAEQTVFSIEDDEAGTIDDSLFIEKGTYYVNGSKGLIIPESGIYIADLKTGSTVDESVWMQLAPYVNCYRKMRLGDPRGAIVMHTGSKNKSGIEGFGTLLRMNYELEEDYKNYKHAAALWRAKNKNFSPNVFEFPSLIKRGK